MIPKQYEKASYENIPKEVKDLLSKIMVTRKGMYIHGPVGSGKTYIAYAMKIQWDENSNQPSIFWNATDLMREIKNDFDRQPIDKNRPEEKILDSNSLLFIDDIGSEKMSDFVAETMYMIINHRYENRLPIIFTSNFPISELAEHIGGTIGNRIASRIVQECDIIELTGDDRRMEYAKKISVRMPFKE